MVSGPTELASPSRGHLWQVDVVRLLTFAAVIAVHVIAFTEQPSDAVAAGAMMLLQFGREVFFALTGFVLVYSVGRKTLEPRRFWRKRVLCVAVPYLAWSGIYYAYSVLGPEHLSPSVGGFALDLLNGGAMYHLYFLLVTLQLYLVFPLLLGFVRRTARIAGRVLVGVAILNLLWLAALQYAPVPGGAGRWFFDHGYELLPTYAMYVLAGCYAASHLDRLRTVARNKRRMLAATALVSTAVALGAYIAQLGWMAPRNANAVLQPAMLLTCLAAVILLCSVGERWVGRGKRGVRTVDSLSDASFGVYLSHPLFLAFLLDFAHIGNTNQALPAPLASLVGFVVATSAAAALSLAVRRTPLSLALAGRPWRKRNVTVEPRAARPASVLGGSDTSTIERPPVAVAS